jgi:hypothetical protein
VGLTVTDSRGQSASDSIEITVEEPATTAAPAEEVVEEDEEPPTDEVPPGGVLQPPETGEEEVEEPNDADSDDGFDVGEFVDDLFDRLGVR